MNFVRVKAQAKINLTLAITSSAGGYHTLDSLVASIDLCDVVSAKRRKDRRVVVTMRGEGCETLPDEENNAYLAAERFVQTFGTEGADITVWKNIPVGAGLGGSSADAAGVLNALSRLYGIGDFSAVKAIADGLGSDCGYMLTGGYARLFGRGERVKRLDSGLKLDIGLLVPRGGVSTAKCYSLYDSMGVISKGDTQNAVNALENADICGLGGSLFNDLYAPAKRLNGEVQSAFKELEAFAPLGVCMTGSGSCVFALFENRMLLDYAASRYRGNARFIRCATTLANDIWKEKI